MTRRARAAAAAADADHPNQTNPDDWREGRYLGREKRGQPSRAAECEFDVRLAIKELETAHALYLLADGIKDRREREDAMRCARERVSLAQRFLHTVLMRPAK